MRTTAEARAGLSILEILILLVLVAILFFVALPILLRSRVLSHEATAIQTLWHIHYKELDYQQNMMGKVGTLAELALVKGINPALATGPVAGYRYRLEITPPEVNAPHLEPASGGTGPAWWCQTVPEIFGSTGERSFHVDQSGVIRAKNSGDGEFRSPAEALQWTPIKEE